MKRIAKSVMITPVLSLILLMSLGGCENSNQIKMGFLYSSDITFRFNQESQFFKKRAEELGAEVIVDHAENNAALQYERAIELMEEDIDLLALIAVNVNTAENIVKEAKARDIPVLAYNRLISNCDLDVYISGDNQQLGKDMIGYTIDRRPKGNYILLHGDRFDRNAVELRASVENELEPYRESGDINVLYESYIEDWNPEHAGYELEQVLKTNPKTVDVVFSAFDGMAVKCIDVLEKYGLAGDVIVTGQDAQVKSCRKIAEGTQHITMYHPLEKIASTAAEVAFDILKGEDLEEKYDITYADNGFKEVPTIKIPSIPVTKENIDEVLIESGFYERSQIYQ